MHNRVNKANKALTTLTTLKDDFGKNFLRESHTMCFFSHQGLSTNLKRGPLFREWYSSEIQCRELGLWREKPRKGDLGSNPNSSTHCFSGLRKLLNPTEGKQCCVHRLFSELNEDMDVEALHIPTYSSLSISVSFLLPEQGSG